MAWVSRHVLGGSLQAIRFLPALAGAGMVFMTGLLARDMGGRSGAVFLACLGVIFAPVYLVGDTLLSMNAFEPLFWMGCLWLVWRAVDRGDPRLWVRAGILAGLGLENKHSTAFFLVALAAGILLSGKWRVIRGPWMWAGLGIALLLFLPNLVWQYLHDWATLELLQNVKRIHKNVELTPWAFVGQQLFILLPTTALIWVAGLWRCLRRRAGGLRLIGWTYLALLAIMIALKAKHYYLAPIYPALFSAGGLWWEELTRKRWPRRAVAGLVAATGALFLPMALPVLAPARLVAYQKTLGIAPPKTEVAHEGPLSQNFGDMFGWPEMVAEVSRVWQSLPPADRARAAILAGNYGEAGGGGLFRTPVQAATLGLRPPGLIFLGSARRHGRCPDPAAVGPRVGRAVVRPRGSRRPCGASLGHGRGALRHPGGAGAESAPPDIMAPIEALELICPQVIPTRKRGLQPV